MKPTVRLSNGWRSFQGQSDSLAAGVDVASGVSRSADAPNGASPPKLRFDLSLPPGVADVSSVNSPDAQETEKGGGMEPSRDTCDVRISCMNRFTCG